MKRGLIVFLFIIGFAPLCSGQNKLIEIFGLRRDDSTWWNKGDKFVGLQTNLATLGTDVIVNGEYFFETNLSANARIGYVGYKPSEKRIVHGHRAVMLSADFNYYASMKKRYAIYAGTGLSFIHFGHRVHSLLDTKLEPYSYGPSLNLFLGAHYLLYKNIALFAEIGRKYSNASISLGANIKLK